MSVNYLSTPPPVSAPTRSETHAWYARAHQGRCAMCRSERLVRDLLDIERATCWPCSQWLLLWACRDDDA